MPIVTAMSYDHEFMTLAYEEARMGYDAGGVPVGAVMVEAGRVIARGHNRRVQDGDPIAHGEMHCLRQAGRRPHYREVTLYTTLSPCMMCSGAILQFGVPRVVVGENQNFDGHPEFLSERGVEIVMLKHAACIELMATFIREKPEVWNEDIAEEL